MTVAQTITRQLCAWAGWIAPPDRRDWAIAMTRELDVIRDEQGALNWALGCFIACLVERIRSMRILTIGLRLALAGACALFALGAALPVALILAYRNGWTAQLDSLEGSLVGDDYARLLPLLESVSSWQVGAGLTAVALYLLAGGLIIFRRASASWVFAAVVVLTGATVAINHSSPLFQQIFTAAELRSDYIGLALKAAVAAMMFWMGRRRSVDLGV